MCLSLLQCFGYDRKLLQIPVSGAVSEDQALLPPTCGEVPRVSGPDSPDPPAGLPLPRLLRSTGLSHRRVLLRPAHRRAEERQHGAVGRPMQARGGGGLRGAQPNQPGGVCASVSAGRVRRSWTGSPGLQLPPALRDAAGVRCPGLGHAFLQRPQHLPVVPAREPEPAQIIQVSAGGCRCPVQPDG